MATPSTSPLCNCGMLAELKVSNSDKNPGREFFTCSTRACDFFKWKDDLLKAKQPPMKQARRIAPIKIKTESGTASPPWVLDINKTLALLSAQVQIAVTKLELQTVLLNKVLQGTITKTEEYEDINPNDEEEEANKQ